GDLHDDFDRVASPAQPTDLQQPAAQACDDAGEDEGHRVDYLDERVDGGAGGVLVRVTHGVADHGCSVGLGTLAAVVAVLDVLLGVVPGAAAVGHRQRHHQAGRDHADEQPA